MSDDLFKAGQNNVPGGGFSRIWKYLAAIAVAAAIAAGLVNFMRVRKEEQRRLLLAQKSVSLAAVEPSYYHDAVIEARLSTKNSEIIERWEKTPPHVKVMRGGQQISSIGGLKEMYMTRVSPGEWKGVFPCPWNAPKGSYTLKLDDAEIPQLLSKYGEGLLQEKGFKILRREPKPLPKRFVVLTLEYSSSYGSLGMKSPDGVSRSFASIADWGKHLEADAVWILVGKTTGDKGRVWNPVEIENVRKIGKACHEKGIKFGVWAMCYLTHPEKNKPWLDRYEWAQDVHDGQPVKVRSVSLRDPKRPDDIADLLAQYAAMPEVDYIGLDYIRNALGGYELAEDFYADFPWINKPQGWDKLSGKEKIVAFARLKIPRKDKELIDAWQWWRAYKVGGIVRRISKRLGTEKPLWGFTLGWEKGWQHGQDPVMMNDAGIDVDAIMLYEANDEQYSGMMKDWHSYVKRGDVQLIVGNIVDWPLHQNGGINAYKKRFMWAIKDIYSDGMAKGLFVHDLGRLIAGRKGPASTADWAAASREAIRQYTQLAEEQAKKPEAPLEEEPVRVSTGVLPAPAKVSPEKPAVTSRKGAVLKQDERPAEKTGSATHVINQGPVKPETVIKEPEGVSTTTFVQQEEPKEDKQPARKAKSSASKPGKKHKKRH